MLLKTNSTGPRGGQRLARACTYSYRGSLIPFSFYCASLLTSCSINEFLSPPCSDICSGERMSKQVIQLGRSKAMSQFSHTNVLPYCSLALPAPTGPVFQKNAFGFPALMMAGQTFSTSSLFHCSYVSTT